jgi:hypothetical protein
MQNRNARDFLAKKHYPAVALPIACGKAGYSPVTAIS